jgi:2-aminoadipate transaminase
MIDSPRFAIQDLFAARARDAAPPLYPSAPVDERLISLTYGFADPELFPYDELAGATAEVLAKEGAIALNYSGSSVELVEQIAGRLRAQGVEAEHENIIVGYGSSELLELMSFVFVEPGDTVIVEGPTFLGAVRKLARTGARVISVPTDAQGLDVDALEDALIRLRRENVRPKYIYTIPTFHNPTGVTMPLARRQRLLALAAEFGVLVLEDDAYGELRFEGEQLPTLATLDGGQGWVVRVCTFSKTLAPGVRMGWAYGNPEIVRRMEMLRPEGESGPLITRVVARFCAEGRLERHIAKLRARYHHKRDVMLAAIARELPVEARPLVPEGGFFVWLPLPEGMSAQALHESARGLGVEFLPGSACFADGQGDDAIRLAFSYQPADKIAEAIARLGAAMRAYTVR